MADGGVTNLLLSMGLDLSPVKAAADTIKTTLNGLNDLADQVASAATGAAAQQSAEMATLKANAQAAVLAAKEAIATENVKAAALKTQTSELQRQRAEQQGVTAAAQAGIAVAKEKQAATFAETAELKRQTAELQRQSAELRQQALAQRASTATSSGGGAPGGAAGLFGRISQGVLGQGIAGSVVGGVLAGEGIISIIEGAGMALEHFIDKLKQVSIESGNLVALQQVFEGLARGAGVDAALMMERLGTASEGLVSKMSLIKEANMALRSPFKLTTDDVVRLTHDVTVLAESSGHTAQQGIDTLTSAFARGRPMTLGAITGVAGLRDVMRDIPSAAGPAERSIIQWQRTMKMLHDQATAIGDLPDTFEKMSTRIKVASENMMLAFGQSFNVSFAGGDTMSAGVAKTTKLFNDLEGAASKAGVMVGNAFKDIGAAIELVDSKASVLQELMKAAFGVGVAYMIEEGVAALFRWGAAALAAAADTGILSTAIKGLQASIGGIVSILAALLGYFSYRFMNDWREGLASATGAAVTWGDIFSGVIDAVKAKLGQLASQWKDIFVGISAAGSGDYAGAAAAFAQSITASTASLDDFVKKAQQARIAQEHLSGMLGMGGAAPHAYATQAQAAAAALLGGQGRSIVMPPELPGASLAEKNRQAQELMQERMKQAQAMLQMKKDEIAQEKALDTENYEYQHESLQQHYATMQDIADKSMAAQRADADQIRAAQLADAQSQLQNGTISQETYQAKVKTATITWLASIEKAESDHALAVLQIQDAGYKDQQEAQARAIQGRLKATEDGINEQMRMLQASLQQGQTDPDTYFAKQIDLTQQLAAARIDAANREYANSADKVAGLQTRANAINAAIDEATAKLEQMSAQQAQIRLSYVQHIFQPQQQAIEAQIGGLQPGQNPQQLQQQMLQTLQQQREMLEQQIQALPQYSDGWNQIYLQIEKVYETQQKYNDELRKSSDLLQPISDALSSITHLIGTVWTSHFVRGLTAGMQGGIEAMRGAVQAGTTIRTAVTGKAAGAVPKDPQMVALENAATSAANTFSQVQTSTGRLVTDFNALASAAENYLDSLRQSPTQDDSGQIPGVPLQTMQNLPTQNAPTPSGSGTSTQSSSATDNPLQRFSAGLVAAVGELSNFADALTKSTSAAGGAASGATAGAGLGQTAMTAFGASGPWGMIAGAVGGALIGAISGAKNAEMSSELNALNTQYTSIMDAFHSNTDNLQEAITQMQDLISEASVDEANSKKGSSQFASLISQYSQQLIQLQDQQSSIISDMETQLAIFSTPTGMQQFLTNLQQIIEQYDKFAGAAENAQQLAQANSWLTDSLSSYTTQMEDTFVQDEEGGISDALQLNSLLSERSTLVSNLNDAVVNVLEQGVLSRQQTTAQTKGQQIEQLESNASSQLQSINQEISLEQYKVAIETSLYNLAMTSMGLEAQLLALQEGQASQSLAAIQALQQLINALQNGSYNFSTISGILVALGYGGSAGQIPGNGLNTAGASAVGAGTNALDALAAAAYQSRATLGYASYRGANL